MQLDKDGLDWTSVPPPNVHMYADERGVILCVGVEWTEPIKDDYRRRHTILMDDDVEEWGEPLVSEQESNQVLLL